MYNVMRRIIWPLQRARNGISKPIIPPWAASAAVSGLGRSSAHRELEPGCASLPGLIHTDMVAKTRRSFQKVFMHGTSYNTGHAERKKTPREVSACEGYFPKQVPAQPLSAAVGQGMQQLWFLRHSLGGLQLNHRIV